MRRQSPVLGITTFLGVYCLIDAKRTLISVAIRSAPGRKASSSGGLYGIG